MGIIENALKETNHNSSSIDYSKIVQSSSFQQLLREKRNFIIPWSIFFLAFYFTLPVLTAYSTILKQSAFGSINWAWVFAAAQFIMTWTLCIMYTNRAAKFDHTVETIKHSIHKEGM